MERKKGERERERGPFLRFPADWTDMSAGVAGQKHNVVLTLEHWPCKIIGKDQRAPTINRWLIRRIMEKQKGRKKQNYWNTDELTYDDEPLE